MIRRPRHAPGAGVALAAPDSDARPSGAPARDVPESESLRRRVRRRRRAVRFALLTLFVVAGAGALLGRGGVLEARALRGRLAALRSDVEARRNEVAALREEVERLGGDPSARERIAREELGLVRPGEIDFLLPRGDAAGGR